MDGAYAEDCLEQFQRMSYGWTAVITFWRKEPWMAVRLCPWMDGISQGAMDDGAVMSMDGRYFARSHGWRCDRLRV
jgi:hypothetical protein